MTARKMRTSRDGLTIVELSVAITVIAILTGVLLLAVQQARGIARKASCANQMRQVGMDRIGKMKTPDLDAVSICPTDPEFSFRQDRGYTGYTWNIIPFRYRNNEISQNSSATIVLFESAPGYYGKSVDPSWWFKRIGSPPVVFDPKVVLERFNGQVEGQRHVGSLANYAYLDGHVETIDFSKIDRWIHKGRNFGLLGHGRD